MPIGEPIQKSKKNFLQTINKKKAISVSLIVLAVGSYYLGMNYFGRKDLTNMNIDIAEIKKNQQLTTTQSTSGKAPAVRTSTTEIVYDTKAIHPISTDDISFAQLKQSLGRAKTFQTGAIWIPNIALNLPIYKGFGGDNQYLGACTYVPRKSTERTMGKGNYVLVGHNSVNLYQLFTPLRNAEKGMEVYLTDYETLFVYKVESNTIVPKTEGEIAEEIPEEDPVIATLITCYGGFGTLQRTYVKCRYVGSQPLEEAADHIQNNFS